MQLDISLINFKPTLSKRRVLKVTLCTRVITETRGLSSMDKSISSFKLEYHISNYSNDELIVKTQGGLNYIIRRQERMVSRNYVSREVDVKISGVKTDDFWLDKRLAQTAFDKAFLVKLEETIERHRTNNRLLSDVFTSDFYVKMSLGQELADENEVIHSDILGISLYNSMEAANIAPLNSHGFVLQELFEQAHEHAMEKPKGGLHYFIYLNDPLSKLNPIYTNVMGKAVRVPVVQDISRPAGLYVGLHYGSIEPQELYFTCDELSKEALGKHGLFETMEECAMGGNTERAIIAEKKLVDNSKAMGGLLKDRTTLEDSLRKTQAEVASLAEELRQATSNHRTETERLKAQQAMALYLRDMTATATSAHHQIKDTVAKASQDIEKKRNSANSWGEIAKAVAAVTTCAVTVYKLYTS